MKTPESKPEKKQTFRQKLLRSTYPLIRKLGKKGKNGTVLANPGSIAPRVSVYSLKISLNNGKILDFSTLQGKKILIVNTASDCGYTGQYAELQSLHEQFGNQLAIIAFPSNDFAGQEEGSDQEIAAFCQLNYGVTFAVAAKGVAIHSDLQQPVFMWLTDKNKNGWNDHAPDWNFGKYIIDETGALKHYFGPSVSPLDKEFISAIR